MSTPFTTIIFEAATTQASSPFILLRAHRATARKTLITMQLKCAHFARNSRCKFIWQFGEIAAIKTNSSRYVGEFFFIPFEHKNFDRYITLDEIAHS